MHSNRIVQVLCSGLVCAFLMVPVALLADQVLMLPGDSPVTVGTQVAGNLIGPDGQTPLAGQEINLYRNGKIVKQVTSGPDGSYSFGDVVPGEYTLEVQGQQVPLNVSPTGSNEPLMTTLPRTVRLPSGTLQVADGEITGQVLHVDGTSPLSDFELSILNNLGATVTRVTTNGAGEYLISNLATGLYALQIGTGVVRFEVVKGIAPRRINLIIPEAFLRQGSSTSGLATWKVVAIPAGVAVIVTGVTLGSIAVFDDDDDDDDVAPPSRPKPTPAPPMSPIIPTELPPS